MQEETATTAMKMKKSPVERKKKKGERKKLKELKSGHKQAC